MELLRVGIALLRREVARVFVNANGSISHESCSTLKEALAGLRIETTVSLAVRTVDLDLRPHGPNLDLLLRCFTRIPEAIADVFGECAFTTGGERIEVWKDESGKSQGRTTPADGPDDEGVLKWRDKEIPIKYAAAFAAAMCDPDRVPNHAGKLAGARQAFLDRLREPIFNAAAAAALLLAGLGVWFHREKGREAEDLKSARHATRELWSRILPGESPKDAGLPKAMLRRIADDSGADGPPSALSFWAEIGRHMPHPDTLGLDLESLDLSPEGGRLSARVPAAKDDPLKNAAALEGHLNQSEKLRARGDYEVRDGKVQVRLRMEFRP